jgi:hypothetical protein
VVVDVADLMQAVDALLAANPGLGALLGVDVGALRAEIAGLLASGDLDSLVSVVPPGDGLFEPAPEGPLAELAGLADVPGSVIGTLRLA